LESALATSTYRLSVLLGREPAALHDELTATGPIPQAPNETFVGVPADLLRQRPDIRAAERVLASETAKIGVAAADLYPRFTLSGTFGVQSSAMDNLLDERSITYGFGPAFRWNIFDGLRNLNRIAAQEAAAQHAYVAYEQTVLIALADVESGMVNYKREQARRDALARATESARRAAELAEKRYEDGLTDFQDVVDAERSLVNLETSLAQSEGQVAVNLVALYKALGGGWTPGVSAQSEYLSAPSEALDDPFGYFLSGGRRSAPWLAPAPSRAAGGQNSDDNK
jgi:NodT family efflux transporter outer membrane factor (OMF) lipoprotein